MNVIILSDRLSTPVRWSLNPRRLGWLCAGLVLLLATVVAVAFAGGRQLGVSRNAASAEIAQLRAELAKYESGLADVRGPRSATSTRWPCAWASSRPRPPGSMHWASA